MFEGYFERKRVELGMDRQDALEGIQKTLDDWYPGRVRAQRLHQGVLRLVTPSAGVAGELRMRQVELLDRAEQLAGERPKRLAISISQLKN